MKHSRGKILTFKPKAQEDPTDPNSPTPPPKGGRQGRIIQLTDMYVMKAAG